MAEVLENFGRFRRGLNLLAVKELKPLGLGLKQAKMLSYLAKHSESSHAELARHTITDPAATGRIVEVLVKRGLLVQKAHPTDRRRWMLSLSPEGRVLAKKTEAAYERVEAVLTASMKAAERDFLVKILDILAISLQGRLHDKAA
jgi:MarR family transcriptional regulator, transcriptional regulator for hemolysin